MDLHWHIDDHGKSRWLYVGCNDAAVALLTRRAKWWSASIFLPECRPQKEFGLLEQQTADVEAKVRNWFGLAMTFRPAQDGDETN